ncbi:MAG: hypothetical protein IIB82_15035 [Bacteroidetes bacterium]|nr:hypothetical protein [Bacteroidota bacterium]
MPVFYPWLSWALPAYSVSDKMEYISYIIPVLAVAVLSAGWAGVQLLARHLGTKNHIDHGGACGNGCTCMGIENGVCHRQQRQD